MKISVVLATYNGTAYVKKQLNSVLPQLKIGDEVIVSDDNSTDDTISVIETLKDSRIRIIINEKPKGPINNFANGLQQATGDIIFLCDQDDLWMDGKVEKCLKLLETYDTVVTDCFIADETLQPTGKSHFEVYGAGKGLLKNLLANTYLGCCMAFKKGVLQIALPFPERIPMHDIWIGFISELFFRPYFLNEKLVCYRRHQFNASTSSEKSKYSFLQKMNFRWNTIRYIPLLWRRWKKKQKLKDRR